jgi:hypothetical protein
VVAHAVPVIGPEDTLTNYFDVLCFIHLDLDYTTVSWTNVNTTGVGYFEGDFDMETPHVADGDQRRFRSLTVVVEFFPMESYEDLNGNPLSGKWIEDFDVSFGVSESSLTPLTRATVTRSSTDQNDPTVGVSTILDDSPGTTLCANEPGKFIYSLHTNGALPGKYAGIVKVSAVIVGSPGVQQHQDQHRRHHRVGRLPRPRRRRQPATAAGPPVPPVAPGNFDDDYGRNQRSVVNP